MRISLNDNIAPSFRKLHHDIKDYRYSTYWLKGGRGSTKSSFIAIQIIRGIVDDPDANAIVLRKVDATLRQSVLATLLWAIGVLGLQDSFDHTKAPAEITYIPTGQKILMKGLDDPLKLKSIKIVKGYFKYLWFEEAAEFAGPEEIRNVEQSVMRGGDRFVEFLSYNPPNDPAAWVNSMADEIQEDRDTHYDTYVHESTYLDVPPEWLGSKFIEEAEKLKKRDLLKYQHEYLGLAVGRAEQIVFHGKWQEKNFIAAAGTRFFFGADWGFASDPTALIRFYMLAEDLYIDYEAFGYHVELDDLKTKIFDTIPESAKWPIKADCSRPETISHVRRKGFRIDGAEKWEGCVEDGIEHLRTFKKIYIHPRCTHLIKEFTLYSYKVDRVTKDILPQLVDKNNHGIDAIRYGLDGYIQRRGVMGVWAKLAK